jgi:riboflavin synthase
MFTGIIESLGTLIKREVDGTNHHLYFESGISKELKVDQSVAHNGVCLTVVDVNGNLHKVTAIEETLKRTQLGDVAPGDQINLERCMKMNGRLDGHIVQGHVDTTGTCTVVEERDGSWNFHFSHPTDNKGYITVAKGSICINGVSLTVVDSQPGGFSVSIIPYTYEHTQFHKLKEGDRVNLEFDILGKYVARLMENHRS